MRLVVVTALFGVLGIGALLCGAYLARREVRFSRRAEPAHGTVVSVIPKPSSSSYTRSAGIQGGHVGPIWYPVIRFVDQAGRPVEFVSEIGYTPARHRTGDRVSLLYDPANPEDARVAGPSRAFGPVIVLALGALFTTIASVFVVVIVLR